MKLGHKISLGFLPVVIMFFLVSTVQFVQLKHSRDHINQIISSNLSELEYAEAFFHAIQNLQKNALLIAMDGVATGTYDAESSATIIGNFNSSLNMAQRAVTLMEKQTLIQIENGDAEGEEDELQEIFHLKRLLVSLSGHAHELKRSLEAEEVERSRAVIENKIEPLAIQMHGIISDLEVDAQEEIDLALVKLQDQLERHMAATALVGMISVTLVIGLALYIMRSISANITRLHQATGLLGQGKLDTRVEVYSSDELGEIASDINSMAAGLRETIVSRDDLAKEVKAREEAEKELQQNEHKYRSIFESSRDTFMLLDQNGFLDCNDSTLHMFGCANRGEFLGHHPMEFSPAVQSDGTPSPEAANRHIETALINGYEMFDWTYQRKSGEIFPAEVLLTRLTLDDKQLLMASVRDISERKRSEAKLHESEKQIRLLLDSAAEAIYGVDVDGNCTMLNKACLSMLGYDSESELLQKNMHKRIHHSHADGTPLSEEHCRVYQAYRQGEAAHVDDEVFWRKDGSSFPISYWVHPIYSDESVIGAVVTFLDITEQVSSRSALKQSREQLQSALEGTIAAVSNAVGARDPYTSGHQQRVAELAKAIAREMGLDEARVKGVFLSATIHDIGKIQLPADILSRPGKLTNAEYQLIKEHSEAGYSILKGISFSWPVAEVAHQHHERMDGSGYPQGLKGDEICLEAKIVAVADVVEAMSSHRPYRPALGIDAALDEIRTHRGSAFDPEVVDACLKLFEEKRFTL
ncbi:PAS domain S-box-containing protein/HDIG domain-containing protein [Mariprofundus ferrinatatus]|uniref:PAS domain S-box-containing protein/HDIG domain-containing protein n=1 Tax=Mariprofundus ferrinatatus TaxID=1921087 RepID=A0A2K8LDW5_9PROT|nr:HD domain-containing phosphohydrolase [Mariprofundus ferrinatatus]ATX83104.1 PAS domain S-box-containing protein/HDIG domain-containing protein [Mariprofundus ferrinatatus]